MAKSVKKMDPMTVEVYPCFVDRDRYWLSEFVDDRQVITISFTDYSQDRWPEVTEELTTTNTHGFTLKEFMDQALSAILKRGNPGDHRFFEGAERDEDGVWSIMLGS